MAETSSAQRLADALKASARACVTAGLSMHESEHLFRRALILFAIEARRGNKCKAAAALGVHRNTITREFKAA